MLRILLVSAICVLSAAGAWALDVAPSGFLVRHELMIGAPAPKVYELLLDVGSWWSDKHTYSGDRHNLSIDARAGGCFCEKLPSGAVEHMRVVYLKANEALRLSGALGPLQAHGVAGAITWRLSPPASGTKVELTYSVGGFETIAPAVETALKEQAERLKRYLETGAPAAK